MHVGPASFLLFPFETMWKSARAGKLHIGDITPPTSHVRSSTILVRRQSLLFAERSQWFSYLGVTLDHHFDGRFPRSTSYISNTGLVWHSTSN